MSSLMGIDLGTHQVAIALFSHTDAGFTMAHGFTHVADTSHPRDVQLADLASVVHGYGQLHQVSSVWIEDVIIGNNRKYSLQLAQVLGAVLADLAHLRHLQGTDIRTVDNKTWKKELVGSGNATKDAVRDYIDVTHPAYAPLCEGEQDIYDAACVGLYGLTILDRAEQLKL